MKIDSLYLGWPEIPLACYDSRILHLECYAPMNTVFFTLAHNSTLVDQYRLFEYDVSTGETRCIVGANRSVPSSSCNRPLSHYWFVFDWRRYWNDGMTKDARLVFISGNELWSYSIETGKCQKMLDLNSIGFSNSIAARGQMLQFDLDWSCFYWINASSYES